MKPDSRRDLVRSIFQEAVAAPEESRAALVESKCGDDPELREEVWSLLAHHQTESGFLERAPVGHPARGDVPGAGDGSGRTLAGGRYRLIRQIGSGGMGVVYEAEQDSPRRRVALKLMRAGAVSPSFARRFRQEGAALARLQHPGIAQVFEAGADVSGEGGPAPFLVMELVRGVALTHFAASKALGVRERAELFLKVCEAVAHAHERGVVHRDLKPANILVDEGGRVKVLDFGIARLAQGESTATFSAGTQSGQVLGTLSYMSPEQARGGSDGLDGRTDVYSLGVILYELLAGRVPIDVSACTLYEGVRRIMDDEPSTLGTLDRSLRGDLETIVSKAIEKDPRRRYASVPALAEDVRRYLGDEPITARPATRWYQLRKFALRHKALVGAVAAVILALSIGLVATAWQAAAARRAWAKARDENAAMRETLAFFSDMLAAVTPERARGNEPTMREALDGAAERLANGEIRSDEVRAALHAEIGRAYAALGEYQTAEQHQRTALELETRVSGAESARVLERIAILARIKDIQGHGDESVPALRSALATSRRVHGAGAECTITLTMQLANALHPAPESVGLYREAYERARETQAETSSLLLMATANYGHGLAMAGELDKAEELTRRALELRTRVFGEDHPQTLDTMSNLAAIMNRRGRHAEACEIMDRMLATQERVLGWTHPGHIADRLNAAMAYAQGGRWDRVRTEMERNVAACAERPEGTAELLRNSRGMLATALINLGEYQRAEGVADVALVEALKTHPEVEPNGDPAEHVFQAWSLYYDLYQAWSVKDPSKAALYETWRQKIASTDVGRRAMEAEAAAAAGK